MRCRGGISPQYWWFSGEGKTGTGKVIYIRDPRPILVLQLQKEVEPLPHPHPDFCTCTYSLQSLAAVHHNEIFLSNDPENMRRGAGTVNETRKAR